MSFPTPDWRRSLQTRALGSTLAAARQTLSAQADAYLAWLPAVPEQQAGYYHNFFCPEHAVQLIFDPHNPQRHVCPVDGAVYSGEPFDSAWLWSVNDMLSDAALKLAVRSVLLERPQGEQLCGQQDRQRVGQILLDYASRYRDLPPAPGIQCPSPGRATWQILDESVWIIRLAWAYALVRDHLSEEQRQLICAGLLRPAAECIKQGRRHDIHNIANWTNAALVTLALVLDDDDLLAEAIDGPAGVHDQLRQGVGRDGLWYEASLSYHYYALAALIWTVRALRAAGRAFEDSGVVQHMLQAPIALAFPDLTLPAIHDCWYGISLTGAVGHGIPDAAGFYEVGYGWYGDPSFAWVLHQNYAQRPRTAFEALLDGAGELRPVQAPVWRSYHAVDTGLAILRPQAGPVLQPYVMLKAGPAQFGHGHPDQLSLQLFACGQRLSSDLGTPGYGIGLNQTWYRSTAGHNTVLIDGQSQPLARGHIDTFDDTGDGCVSGSVSWQEGAYAGVQMRRVITWRAGCCIDVFVVQCAVPRQIDWLYHNRGRLTGMPRAIARDPLPEPVYQHVSDVRRIERRQGIALQWQLGQACLAVYLSPCRQGEVFLGNAPANPASELQSLLIRRQVAARAVFATIYVPWPAAGEPEVQNVRWRSHAGEPVEVSIQTTSGSERWPISRFLHEGHEAGVTMGTG